MRSSRPKPLHRLCGRPMVLHVLDALAELDLDRAVVVVGHGAERVTKAVLRAGAAGPAHRLRRAARPAGHRRRRARSALTAFPDDPDEDGDIVVLPGDTPLLRPPTLAALVRTHRGDRRRRHGPHRPRRRRRPGTAASCATRRTGWPASSSRPTPPTTSSPSTRSTRSIYVFRRRLLAPALRRLSPDNAQGEYYLTDIVEVLSRRRLPGRRRWSVDDPMEAAGVNDRAQLAVAEAELRDRINERWMRRGVTMLDPERTYVDATVELDADVTLFPGTLLQGRTVVAAGSEIGPNTHLVDCIVGAGAVGLLHRRSQLRHRRRRRGRPFAYPPARIPGGARSRHRAMLHWHGAMNDEAGHLMELVPKRKLQLLSGRTHPALAEEIAAHLGVELGEPQPGRLRQRRDPAPLRGVGPGRRRVHHPVPLPHARPVGQRLAHGAVAHDRRRQAGVGQAHHRGVPLLRLLPPGPQVQGSRADHRPPGLGLLLRRRRRPDHVGRPALRADPGLLRRPGRPPDGGPAARPTTCATTPRRRLRHGGPRHRPHQGGRAGRPPLAGDVDVASVYKRRPKDAVNQVQALDVMGDVDGRMCVLIDDMIDTAGTICAAADLLLGKGRDRGVGHGHPRRAVGPGDRPAQELADRPGGRDRHAAAARPRSRSTRSRWSRSPRCSPTPSTPSSRTDRSRRSSAARTRPELVAGLPGWLEMPCPRQVCS